METIPLLDLKEQYGPFKSDLLGAFENLLESGQFILGHELEQLERELALYLSAVSAFGVTSGTDALWLGLKSVGVGKGDRVLTSPFTFFATVSAICNVGAEPLFADILPNTFNLDPDAVEEAFKKDKNKKIKALLPVHIFGQAANMTRLCEIAEKYGVPIIEDAAQAIGSKWENKSAGTFGEVGCFSFFPTKNLGALGDAGCVVTGHPKTAEKLQLLRVHGSHKKYYHEIIGGNFRMDNIQAAFVRIFLRHLDQWLEERRTIANHYNQSFQGLELVRPPFTDPNARHVYHQYTVRVKNNKRDTLKDRLEEQGISSCVYYPVPCHLQPALKYLGFEKGMFPVSELAADEVLSLPVYPSMKKSDRDKIVSAVTRFVG